MSCIFYEYIISLQGIVPSSKKLGLNPVEFINIGVYMPTVYKRTYFYFNTYYLTKNSASLQL